MKVLKSIFLYYLSILYSKHVNWARKVTERYLQMETNDKYKNINNK